MDTSYNKLRRLREGLPPKMARRKKDSNLGGNEILFSGRKLQVPIRTTDLCILKDRHYDQKRIKIKACWTALGSYRFFHSYEAVIDSRIDCLALINQPIAATAARYQVADILPLREWKDGAVVLSGLKVNDQELKDVPMLVADLDCECDVVLGRRWVEEFGQGWLEEPEPRMSPEEVITPSHELQEDLAVRESRIDGVPECASRGDDKSEDYFDDRQVISAGQEDFCSSRTPIAESQCIRPILRFPRRDSRPYGLDGRLSVGNPEPPTTTSKDRIVVDEGVVARLTIRFPGQRNKEDLSVCHELDAPDEDVSRSRTPISDDQCIRPLVRLGFQESDPRFFSPNSISSPARTPEAPAVTAREDWMIISENITVRLPKYRHDEARTSQKDDGHRSGSERDVLNLTHGESPRLVELSDRYPERTDVVDSSGRGRDVNALIANQPPNKRPNDAPSFCVEYKTYPLSDWTKIPDQVVIYPDLTNEFQTWNSESAVVLDADGKPTARRERNPRTLQTLCSDVFLDPAYGSTAWIDTGQTFRLTVDKSKALLLSNYWHISDTFSDPMKQFVKPDPISGCQDGFFMKLSTSCCAHNWSIWFLQISSPDGLLGVFTNPIFQLASWVDCESRFVGKEVFMKPAISQNHSRFNGHYNDSYKSLPDGYYSTWKGAGLPTMFRNSQIMSSIFLNVAVLLLIATAWFDTGWPFMYLFRWSF
ncbi:hypothetical protein V8E54_001405 [Elaphomyces granulatus]